MKKKQKIILFIVISFVVILLFAIFYNSDEKVYISKDYNPDTKVTSTYEYVKRSGKAVLHGKFRDINEKGITIAEGNFIDGDIKGKCVYYYDNGNIETIQFKVSTKVTEDAFFYNQNQKIDKYVMYDDFGKPIFMISYDDSSVISYDGKPLVETYQYKIINKEDFEFKMQQSLKVGDTVKYQYLLANIPHAKRSFKIENLSVDNKNFKRTIIRKSRTIIEVKEVLTKKGINTIRASVQYKFDDGITPVFNATNSFDVQVD